MSDEQRRPDRTQRRPGAPRSGRPDGPKKDGVKKPGFAARRPAPREKDDRPRQATPARIAALEAVGEVLDKGAFVSEAVDRQLSRSTLPQNDRRFMTALVYGTLENLTAIDHVLDAFIEDTAQLDPQVRNILRLAVCQKRYMDRVPDSAIADEAVRMTRQRGLEYMTGFVNGVLRNYFREPEKPVWPDREADFPGWLSLTCSMPRWIVEKLIEDYGGETAEKILSHHPASHGMTVRPNVSRLSDEDFERLLAGKVWQAEKGRVPHAWRLNGVMQVARDSNYLAGDFSIQGEASMLCAQLAAVRPGMNVLDACAAPGGKTAYMAEQMHGTGRVYAWDLHEHRVALLNAMKRRLQLDNIRTAAHDARAVKEDFVRRMDVCLVDAPCTGLGVINDKPDIKYGVTEESLAELVRTQREILTACCEYVKPGGALVYSTCSMLRDENERMAEWFLQQHPEFSPEPVPDWVRRLYPEARTETGLQLLPGADGDEGFYIARFRRER